MASNNSENIMPTQNRRVSSRRGSVTASDPFGAHNALNLDPNRSSSSTLTIVRVLSPQPSPTPQEPPSSPVLSHRRSLHRRNQSNPPAPEQPLTGRLSFAFSTFSPPAPAPASPSPSSSPRIRPSSPHIRPSSPHRPTSASFTSKPRLTADQLVDLARQASNPRNVGLVSPALAASPATFTPLPADIYLPFLDRPSEVATLLSTPPSAKLFSLLSQTFPNPLPPSPSISFSRTSSDPPILPADPTTWSFSDLTAWLIQTPRSTAPDALWVSHARKCVLSHSELIWERLKGALGVPPDLDLDTYPDDSDSALWTDWDTASSSPVAARAEDIFKADLSSALEAVSAPVSAPPPLDSPPDDTVSPTPVSDHLHAPAFEPTLSISPVLLSPHPSFAAPPPLSLPASVSPGVDPGLQDISEDAEDDDAPAADKPSTDTDDEPQIQGLRISTTPCRVASPVAPLSRSSSFSSHRAGSFSAPASRPATSREGSFSSHRLPARTSSFSAAGPGMFRSLRAASFGSAGSGAVEDDDEPEPEGWVERGPGSPLFPSNFARLDARPTFGLRSGRVVPGWVRGRWGPGVGVGGSEYAVTVSGSERGSSVGRD